MPAKALAAASALCENILCCKHLSFPRACEKPGMTRSARAFRAAHSTQKASREILVSLLCFSAGVQKTRNDPQCPRVKGGTLDVNGVNRNYLKFGNSAVRPSAADPFCGSWWEKSWGSRGPEAAFASPKKSPHRTAGDPLCCSCGRRLVGVRGARRRHSLHLRSLLTEQLFPKETSDSWRLAL